MTSSAMTRYRYGRPFQPVHLPVGYDRRGENDSSILVVRRGTEEYVPPHLSKDQGIHLEGGDTILVWSPGGGGYGEPFERDPKAVSRDVQYGYFTVEDALAEYGVVLRPGTLAVNEKATELARARRARRTSE